MNLGLVEILTIGEDPVALLAGELACDAEFVQHVHAALAVGKVRPGVFPTSCSVVTGRLLRAFPILLLALPCLRAGRPRRQLLGAPSSKVGSAQRSKDPRSTTGQ